MRTSYNKKYCAQCGAPSEDWHESVNGVRVWVCGNAECNRKIEQELREEEREDHYGGSSWR